MRAEIPSQAAQAARLRSSLLAVLVALGIGSIAPAALGETDAERAGARSAATSGADAYDAGKYQDALAMFQRAEALVHSPVHLSYIAKCQVKLGQLVEARETYLKLKRDTVPPGAHPAVKRAVDEAPANLAALEPRVPTLAIKLEGVNPGESVAVTVDGTKVAPALVGIPAPTNPGEHVINATAPGKDSGAVRVSLSEGQHQEVLVRLNAAAADPAATAAPAAAGGGAAPATSATADKGSSGSGLAIPAYVSLGVGVVGLGLGTYFAIDSGNAADDADALCGGSRGECVLQPGATPEDVESKNDQAGQSQTLAIVGFAVGGVGIAAGVTLLVLSMNDHGETARAPRVVPYASWDRIGVVGRF